MSSLSRSHSKRHRDEADEITSDPAASPVKRHQRKPSSAAHAQSKPAAPALTASTELDEERALLWNLFQALETALLASLSPSPSFHGLQDAVTYTARSDFELGHLSQLVGVQPDAYTFDSVMIVHKGSLIPSLSITPQISDPGQRIGSTARQEHFKALLALWDGRKGDLPEIRQQMYKPDLSESKRILLQKPVLRIAAIDEPGALLKGTAQTRESALLDRILAKKRARLEQGVQSSEDLTTATIMALIPTALASIRVLLASKPKAAAKSLGMRELVDNLKTSLRARTGEAEVARIVKQLAAQYPAWCKIGQVGQVEVVRFIGEAPRL
jgi:hypothetical protein